MPDELEPERFVSVPDDKIRLLDEPGAVRFVDRNVHAARPGLMDDVLVLASLRVDRSPRFDALREEVTEWATATGIDANLAVGEQSFYIVMDDAGTVSVIWWAAKESGDFPPCPTCPRCCQSTPVLTLLTAPIPERVAQGLMNRYDAEGLPGINVAAIRQGSASKAA